MAMPCARCWGHCRQPEPATASGWRNVDPAEMRSWRGARGVSLGRTLAVAGIGLVTVLALVFVLRVAIGLRQAEILRREARAAQTIEASTIAPPRPRIVHLPKAMAVPPPPSTAPAPPKIQFGMTEEEKAEWNRRNAESMKIIEKTTPEM